MKHRAGDVVEYIVTHLAMEQRPSYPRPRMPAGATSALIAADNPPPWYFLSLYDTVGREYEWTDQHERPVEELSSYLGDPAVTLYTFLRAGWPHGFFLLDAREPGTCEIAYFGLVPEAIGHRFGGFLLETAVHMAWDRPGTRRVTVSTNTLDHPRALALYQKAGFAPERRVTLRRVLTRDHDLIGV